MQDAAGPAPAAVPTKVEAPAHGGAADGSGRGPAAAGATGENVLGYGSAGVCPSKAVCCIHVVQAVQMGDGVAQQQIGLQARSAPRT